MTSNQLGAKGDHINFRFLSKRTIRLGCNAIFTDILKRSVEI
ncbi:hypothetical protein SH601_08660 [Gracilibacillus sp. S3-1-1]|uniref:Uncharacterized protein n=1 Tax=Gracilibacillus pellucidus TaxID=3095368 RepID=A0ACC6M571_9BACI|nr:hypothetical protein [Gracilibacillus sp. S3-1-1]MDX8046058.1 hypothetical protein [Gracilibacillus sp. S3-1-1]